MTNKEIKKEIIKLKKQKRDIYKQSNKLQSQAEKLKKQAKKLRQTADKLENQIDKLVDKYRENNNDQVLEYYTKVKFTYINPWNPSEIVVGQEGHIVFDHFNFDTMETLYNILCDGGGHAYNLRRSEITVLEDDRIRLEE